MGSGRLVDSRVCVLVGFSCIKRAWSKVSLARVYYVSPCMFRNIVDAEVNLIICGNVKNLVAAAKDKRRLMDLMLN